MDIENSNLPENEEVGSEAVAQTDAVADNASYAPLPLTEDTPIPDENPIVNESPIPDENPIVNESPIPDESPIGDENPIPEKKSKKPLIIAVCCAALVIALGVLAAVFLPRLLDKSFYAQMERVSDKMKNVSSFAMNADVSATMHTGEKVTISTNGKVSIDSQNKVIKCYLEYGYGNNATELYLESTSDKVTYYVYIPTYGQWVMQSEDIAINSDTEDLDIEALLQQAGMDKYINSERVPELIQTLEDKVKDEQYLKDVWGYTREEEGGDTVYAFAPALEKATTELLKDIQLILTEETIDGAELPSEEEIAQELDGIACEMELTTDAQNYLKSLLLTVELNEKISGELGHLALDIEFSDYNNADFEIPAEVIQNAVSGG